MPTAENVLHYARLVREKATLRRLIATCAEVQSSAYGDFGEFETFLDDEGSVLVRGPNGIGLLDDRDLERYAEIGERLPRIALHADVTRQCHRGKNADDGNDHDEFDQGETLAVFH